MDEFNYDNEIIEVDSDKAKEEAIEELMDNEEKSTTKNKKSKKNKKSLKEKWNELSKKQKIAIIVVGGLILILIWGLIIYFVFFNKPETKPIKEVVVVEKDNYRYEDGKLIFLDKNDRELGSYTCKNKDSNKCIVAKSDYSLDKFERVLSVYEDGSELEKSVPIYNDKYVFVKDGEEIFIYDIEEKKSNENFQLIKSYSSKDNLVVVENKDNLYGLIKINENDYEYLIDCTYTYLGVVNNELEYLVATDKDKTYVIDSNNKKLSPSITSTIMNANASYVVVKNNNTYKLYDYSNNEKLSDYEYIGLNGEIISLVNNNRLYLMDNKLNKLYEEGIKLPNNDYVKKYIYDKDNKLKETKKAYEVTVSEGVVSVNIDDETKNINLADVTLSANLAYMNYFDGKLYFYSDQEKKDLIGKYECQNKNSSNLDKCYVYNTNNMYSGIYNNQYVFIFDNALSANGKIYLYDIKNSKTKGTYNMIEFLDNSALNSTVQPVFTNSLFIKAKVASGDNKGNLGILEIASDKASGKIEFKYKSIDKTSNNYYLLINVDDSYSIYDSNFIKISNEFDYIKTFDKYYVGINNKKLDIYEYDKNKQMGILGGNALTVSSNNFEFSYDANSFKITIDGKIRKFDYSGNEITATENPDPVGSDNEE